MAGRTYGNDNNIDPDQQKRLEALAKAKAEAERGSASHLSIASNRKRGRKPKGEEAILKEQWTCKFPKHILDIVRLSCPALYKDLTAFIVDAVSEKYEREKDLIIKVSEFQRQTNEQAAKLREILNSQAKLEEPQQKEEKTEDSSTDNE